MSTSLESKLPDSDMQEAPKALLRAARRARDVARQKGTGIVIFRDGKVQEVNPDEVEDPRDVSQTDELKS